LGLKIIEDRRLQFFIVTLTSLLSLAHLPVISVISAWVLYAVVALVTLRRGVSYAGFLLGAPLVILASLAWLGSSWIMLALLATYLLVVFGASVILHDRASWHDVLLFLMLMGGAAVLLVYQLNPDMDAFWRTLLMAQLAPFFADLPKDHLALLIDGLAQHMTGLVVFAELCQVVLILMIARAWQSSLFMPGGYQKELHTIRMKQWISLVVILPFVIVFEPLASFVPGFLSEAVSGLAIVVLLPLFVVGISLMHAYNNHRGWGSKGLCFCYLLFFILQVYFVAWLCVWGVLDSAVDFRKRYGWRLGGDIDNQLNLDK
jgi:hypothetical protein